MSLKTWKQEFYPIEADDKFVQRNNATRLEHSLLKWIGLREGNLRNHGVTSNHDAKCLIYRYEDFYITDESCALCVKHMDIKSCNACPLLKITGNECGDSDSDPYHVWRTTGNPEPMIEALQKALDRIKKKSARDKNRTRFTKAAREATVPVQIDEEGKICVVGLESILFPERPYSNSINSVSAITKKNFTIPKTVNVRNGFSNVATAIHNERVRTQGDLSFYDDDSKTVYMPLPEFVRKLKAQ